VQLRIEVGITI